jgi:hypothetical protein
MTLILRLGVRTNLRMGSLWVLISDFSFFCLSELTSNFALFVYGGMVLVCVNYVICP